MSTKIILSLPRRHPTQERAKREARRFNALAWGRRAGKTVLGIDRGVEAALAGKPVAWFSPTYKMLSEVWREMRLVLQPVTARCTASEHRLQLVTGGVVDMWSLDNPNVARGRKYARVILDEWAMVGAAAEAWQEVIRPTLADLHGDAWFLSTPKGRNLFWQMYQWGQDPTMTDWYSLQVPTSANPFIARAEIEAMRHDLPELVYQQEVLAEFLEGEGVVFRNIAACLGAPETTPEAHKGHYLSVGVDWAKQQDYSAFSVVCHDCKAEVAHDRFNQVDYVVQRGRLQALYEKWRPELILCESNSIGEPILEELFRADLPVRGFETTASTKPPLIENLALAFERAEWQWLDDPVWTAELEAYERKVSPVTGRSSYSAPEGMHDDTVMARALAIRYGLMAGSLAV